MMKKLVLLGILLALCVPALALAEDKPAGPPPVVVLGHIDFVGRFSSPDWVDASENWNGYETYNLEHAVLGVAGRLGNNVDWMIVYAFAFDGPFGPYNSMMGMSTNDSDGMLLDARIDWHLNDMITLSAGRFIPPTSMTWAPHLMKVMHTINYPLINNGGLAGNLIPSPMYQTGVMATFKSSGLSVQVGNFNGSEIVAGQEGLGIFGLNNTRDIDKTKGTAAKIAYDAQGLHVGGWYFGEEVGIAGGSMDSKLDQWGAEVGFENENLILQGQYLSSNLDAKDKVVKDNLVQDGWYGLVGVQASGVQLLYRYDTVNFDNDNVMYDANFIDHENAHTVGINYLVNPNVTAGINYVWRQIDDYDANTNELAFILEANMF